MAKISSNYKPQASCYECSKTTFESFTLFSPILWSRPQEFRSIVEFFEFHCSMFFFPRLQLCIIFLQQSHVACLFHLVVCLLQVASIYLDK